MSVPQAARQTPHAWATIAQPIVDDLYALQQYDNVMLCEFNRTTGLSTPVAWAGRYSEISRRTANRLSRLFPGANPWEIATRWDTNPHLRRLWTSGDTVIESVTNLNEGVNAGDVMAAICKILGIRYGICVPLRIDSVSIGSLLGFQRSSVFPESQVRSTEAVARHVALSIHNMQLLELQQKTSAALASSMQLLGQAEERTRRDISEFLHSQVQSKLLVAWSRLADIRVQDAASQHELNAIRHDLELLRERDIRLVSHQLHPEALNVGLIPALQVLSSRFRGAMQVHLVTNEFLADMDNQGSPHLPHSLRLTVFRIAEEALNNALKHGGAHRVTVTVTVQDHALQLSICDDGCGFDPPVISYGLGLHCLDARVTASQGQWTLDSRPGGPTTVRARWTI